MLLDCAVCHYVPPTDHEHHWSGWPGAYCLDCHAEEPNEICMGGCKCPCHDEFWAAYAAYEAGTQALDTEDFVTLEQMEREVSNDR